MSNRNNALTSLAGQLRAQGLEEDEIFSRLMAAPERADLPESEVRTIARSIGSKPRGIPPRERAQLQNDEPLKEFSLIRGWSIESLKAMGCSQHATYQLNLKQRRRVVQFPTFDNQGIEQGSRFRHSNNQPFFNNIKSESPKGSKLGLFYARPFSQNFAGPILLVEGEADTAAAFTAGYPAVIGTAGSKVSARARTWLSSMCKGRDVILCPDHGVAGIEWRDELAQLLRGVQCSVTYIPPDPKQTDLDDRLKYSPNKQDRLKQLIASKVEWTHPDPKPKPLWEDIKRTDMFNGERFAQENTGRALFVPELDCWHAFDGHQWVEDKKQLQIDTMAKKTILGLEREMHNVKETEQQNLAKFIQRSCSKNSIQNMTIMARSEPGMSASASDFDQDPWLLNLANGTLDLRTGQLHPHKPENRIKKQTGIVWDENAKAPRFEQFIYEIFDNSIPLIQYMKRLIGYTISGSVKEQGLYIWHGSGANGKSVLANIVMELMGNYAHKCSSEMFIDQKPRGPEAPSPHLVALQGKRFAVGSETAPGRKLAENTLKDLTGGEEINARALYHGEMKFIPTHKLFLLTNHKPKTTQDPALWRRMRLIPFNISFEGREDRELPQTLRNELSGILKWAVEGCLEWQKDGLMTPDEVLTATNEYRHEEDLFGTFLDDVCTLDESQQVSASTLYKNYKIWCDLVGCKAFSQREFGKEMGNHNFSKIKNSVYFYEGLNLSQEWLQRDQRDERDQFPENPATENSYTRARVREDSEIRSRSSRDFQSDFTEASF